MPTRIYRQISDIERRLLRLPSGILAMMLIDSGWLEPPRTDLSDAERAELTRLVRLAVDPRGALVWERLTNDQRMYVSERLPKMHESSPWRRG